jgi:4-hydroxy-tetrahydrodipicolinate synthase
VTPFPYFVPQGVIPATLIAFHEDLSIDERATRKHLQDVADVAGISAITVNGHSSEVHACTFDEQRRLLEIASEVIGNRIPVISGVYADGSAEAARIARMAQNSGASALLVFPPHTLQMGGQLRPEMAIAHYKAIAEASDLPIIAFVYPESSGVKYSFETLLRLFEEVPTIRAIKDWCNDPLLHERHVRTFQSLARPVNVLTTHSSWLLQSLVTGCKGVLSGAGSVLAHLQVAMFEAVQNNDLAAARVVNQRYAPMAHVFYAPPFLDMHNRMKECLVMQGHLNAAFVRPPLMKLSAGELERIAEALRVTGLGDARRSVAA